MHHVGREVITGSRTAHAGSLGYLDPELVVIEFRQRIRGADGSALELHKGVALVHAARRHLWPETIVFRVAGVLGLAVGLLADEDGRLLVDAVAQGVLPGDAIVVGLHRGHDAVLGFVGNRVVVNGQADMGIGAGLDARGQQGGDLVRIGPVDNLEHGPVDNIAGIALGCTCLITHLVLFLLGLGSDWAVA